MECVEMEVEVEGVGVEVEVEVEGVGEESLGSEAPEAELVQLPVPAGLQLAALE